MSSSRISPQVVQIQDVPVTNPNNITAVYSNHFGVGATLTDFSIFFLEVGQLPGGLAESKQHQTVKAIVTLPLSAAHGLQVVLGELLKQATATAKAQAEARAKQ